MKTNAARVREFLGAVGVEPPQRPTVPTLPVLELHRTLIREEYAEVMEALDGLQAGETSLPQVAHELADLLYVTYDAFAILGIDADAVFAEVHRANMDKTSGPKRADGKQLKPEGWQPANVRGVIEQLANQEA